MHSNEGLLKRETHILSGVLKAGEDEGSQKQNLLLAKMTVTAQQDGR